MPRQNVVSILDATHADEPDYQGGPCMIHGRMDCAVCCMDFDDAEPWLEMERRTR